LKSCKQVLSFQFSARTWSVECWHRVGAQSAEEME
jgi:hypothetical protein